jgi:hypothetical protein
MHVHIPASRPHRFVADGQEKGFQSTVLMLSVINNAIHAHISTHTHTHKQEARSVIDNALVLACAQIGMMSGLAENASSPSLAVSSPEASQI